MTDHRLHDSPTPSTFKETFIGLRTWVDLKKLPINENREEQHLTKLIEPCAFIRMGADNPLCLYLLYQ